MLELLLTLIVLALLPAIFSVLAFLLTVIGLGSYHLLRSAGLAGLVVGLPIVATQLATSAPAQLVLFFAGLWLAGKAWTALDPSINEGAPE